MIGSTIITYLVMVVTCCAHDTILSCTMAGVAGSESPVVAGPTTKKHQDEETQGLEKVTDYVEETENSAELGQVEHFCFALDPFKL